MAKPIRSVFVAPEAAVPGDSRTSHIWDLPIDRLNDILIACFAEGTMIETTAGLRRVEALRVGDRLLTQDHGPQPLRWTGSQRIELTDLNDHLRPILISAGALGEELPQADLRVSPQHRVLVRSAVARRMFGTEEVLVAAKHLVGLPGISVDQTSRRIVYVHLLLDRHEIVFSNGAPTESLFTGPMALKSVSEAARAEIFELFPELIEIGEEMEAREPIRLLVPGRRGRQLAERHRNNRQPIYQTAL
ncbi:Hint domain-containing protein [Paracoccus caeni]|uniref:Hint domain-containing protein n=2 Tax=Paracoccus caeni TaxID=657651 RepID=A0A934SJC5_9RHOB|nr:Hint domain-containing protein [Paracoccus caeni]